MVNCTPSLLIRCHDIPYAYSFSNFTSPRSHFSSPSSVHLHIFSRSNSYLSSSGYHSFSNQFSVWLFCLRIRVWFHHLPMNYMWTDAFMHILSRFIGGEPGRNRRSPSSFCQCVSHAAIGLRRQQISHRDTLPLESIGTEERAPCSHRYRSGWTAEECASSRYLQAGLG